MRRWRSDIYAAGWHPSDCWEEVPEDGPSTAILQGKIDRLERQVAFMIGSQEAQRQRLRERGSATPKGRVRKGYTASV